MKYYWQKRLKMGEFACDMNPKRVYELQDMFKDSNHGLIFVSAFLDFVEFKKHSKEISWETEVW
ncbi:MAG: hypothetical protein GF401_17195, partial [Chitinivibrionales bacterium]|nr:hypothetical protein [Chitinivibrionales bacterium]